MTPDLAMGLGRAMGDWLQGDDPWPVSGARPCVVVGRDARGSGEMLQSACTAGLLAAGCDVLDAGVAPTPAIQYSVRQLAEVDLGVIITASHNPAPFNGLKVCRGDGREAEPEQEERIEARYFGEKPHGRSWREHGALRLLDGVLARYEDAVAAQVDVRSIQAAAPVVVVDTANGAACVSLPRLLGRIGCRVVSLNAHPDSAFPGHPSEPTEEYSGDVQALVKRHGALCGVMVDGDGDRAVFLDEEGRFVPGEKSLALLAADAVKKQGGGTVCTPVSSSSVVELAVREAGGVTRYCVVGSPKVARAMVDSDAVFGGEENGGIIVPDHQHTRDGAIAAARLIELLVTSDRPLSQVVARLPKRAMLKRKVPVAAEDMAPLVQVFADKAEAGSLPGEYEKVRVDGTDGVKLYMEGGWVLVRASGTEPLVRLYTEAETEELAAAMADTFETFLGQLRDQTLSA